MQVIVVQNPEQGIERAKEELYTRVDNKTVLFLSGGSTPQPLYQLLAKEEVIKPAAVAMVDERFYPPANASVSLRAGEKMHENSNEKMIKDTGFLRYLSILDIPFYPILQPDLSLEETAESYDEKVRNLFFHFPKSVGVMGIGADGHIAGIPPSTVIPHLMRDPDNSDSRLRENDIFRTHNFVTSYNAPKTYFKKRVTLTFAGLALLDYFIVLAFGKEKSKALQNAFNPGSMEEIPARFYLADDQAKKTLFITDQKV